MSRMSLRAIDLKGFRSWLEQQGVAIEEPTNEYEALRYRVNRKIAIIYTKPTKGTFTLCGLAPGHYFDGFLKNRPIAGLQVESNTPPQTGEIALYTDASNYHLTGSGAWGAILVLPGGREIEASGPLKGKITSSTDAEAKAVANALHKFLKAGEITPGARVRVIGDNRAVIAYVASGNTKRSKSQGCKDAIAYIMKLRDQFSLAIRSEWVKGHQPVTSRDPRAAYNRRCDALCTAHSKTLHKNRQNRAKKSAKVAAMNEAAQEIEA